jgi:hypothetical protein
MSELLDRIRALEVSMDRLFITNLAVSIVFGVMIINNMLAHKEERMESLMKLSVAQLGEIRVKNI